MEQPQQRTIWTYIEKLGQIVADSGWSSIGSFGPDVISGTADDNRQVGNTSRDARGDRPHGDSAEDHFWQCANGGQRVYGGGCQRKQKMNSSRKKENYHRIEAHARG